MRLSLLFEFVTSNIFSFYIHREMSQATPKKSLKVVDGTGTHPIQWYLDLYLPNGRCNEKVHLFIKDHEESPFKDCEVVRELKEDTSNLDMTSCIHVKTVNGPSYLLDPRAFAHDLLNVSDAEVTMAKAGWVEIKEDTPIETFIDLYIEGFKKVSQYLTKFRAKMNKKCKIEGTGDAGQSKTLKESVALPPGNTNTNEEQGNLSIVSLEAQAMGESIILETPSMAVVVNSASAALLDSIVQPSEKELDKEVTKTSKCGLDGYVGIEHYFKFGVQYTSLISVELCNLAPEAYKCRPLSDAYVKYLLKVFAGHSRPVSIAADLMPYDPLTNMPLKTEEVHADKLDTYQYWIISGQHSIMAARIFLRNKRRKYALRKVFYERRIARIVVDAPKEVVVRISRMENIETQTVMKTQPYVEVLKHGRGQWLAYSCPSKPKPGVPIGHDSRRLWDVSSISLLNIT